MKRYWRNFKKKRTGVTKDNTIFYSASKYDCDICEHKPRCCPNVPQRKIRRSIYESSRDVARAVAQTPAYKKTRRQRKKVEMLSAHMKRILKVDRLRLHGMSGAHDEFLLTATVQNLLRMAQLLRQPPDSRIGVPALPQINRFIQQSLSSEPMMAHQEDHPLPNDWQQPALSCEYRVFQHNRPTAEALVRFVQELNNSRLRAG